MSQNEKKYVEKVLNKYSEKEVTKLDELRALDKKATKGATLFASIFGAISSLIFGFGMCVAMGVILAGYMWVGIIVGIIGILCCILNYYIYKALIKRGRVKYGPQIQALSNEILNR